MMKAKDSNKKLPGKDTGNESGNEFPGYPAYPAGDDIFNKFQEEKDVNPEDITKNKELTEKSGSERVKDLTSEASPDDLDVPGSELDDEPEAVGSEDEENNYYSIGGDDHNDLDENKGS